MRAAIVSYRSRRSDCARRSAESISLRRFMEGVIDGVTATGIFALGTAAHAYLEFDVVASADGPTAVADVARLREPRTTIGGVNLVAGFRPELWAVVAPDAAPAGVVGFNEPVGGGAAHDMPATQHDIVVWIAGASYDVVFDTSRSIVAGLAGRATLAHEVVGWQYHHDRDLTGFEDGTENPSIVEAMSVALVPPGQAGEGRRSSSSSNGSTTRSAGRTFRSSRRKRSSVAGSQTARNSIQSRRPRMSRAPIRIGSARSSGGTSPTGP